MRTIDTMLDTFWTHVPATPAQVHTYVEALRTAGFAIEEDFEGAEDDTYFFIRDPSGLGITVAIIADDGVSLYI